MIIKNIVQNPSSYKSIIQHATFNELKEVYTSYMQFHTSDNVHLMVQNYFEAALREKLLGCSLVVVSTLCKKGS